MSRQVQLWLAGTTWVASFTGDLVPACLTAMLLERDSLLLLWPGTTNAVGMCRHKLACSGSWGSDWCGHWMQFCPHLGTLWGYSDSSPEAAFSCQSSQSLLHMLLPYDSGCTVLCFCFYYVCGFISEQTWGHWLAYCLSVCPPNSIPQPYHLFPSQQRGEGSREEGQWKDQNFVERHLIISFDITHIQGKCNTQMACESFCRIKINANKCTTEFSTYYAAYVQSFRQINQR